MRPFEERHSIWADHTRQRGLQRRRPPERCARSVSCAALGFVVCAMLDAGPAVASQAIAVWATPDSTTVTGTARIGVVAYHSSGIKEVTFQIDAGSVTSVKSETINPSTGEYEYVFNIDTRQLADKTAHTVVAKALPNVGQSMTLPGLIIQVDNSPSQAVWYVNRTTGNDSNDGKTSSTAFASIARAVGTEWPPPPFGQAARSGDTVVVSSGIYELPSGQYGGYYEPLGLHTEQSTFSKFVTIKAQTGANVAIKAAYGTSAFRLRTPFLKFEGIHFDRSGVQSHTEQSLSVGDVSRGYGAEHHVWFKDCTFTGVGHNEVSSSEFGLVVYQGAHHIVVESSEFRELGAGICVTSEGGNFIVRQNSIHHMASDGIEFGGQNLLVSGNLLHDIQAPAGGTQHVDAIATHFDAKNVVIRNNIAYKNRSQGLFFSRGESADPDAPYSTTRTNVAVINNVFGIYSDHYAFAITLNATHQDQSPNPLDENAYIYNLLMEYNTVWPAASPLRIEYSPGYSADVVIRNNVFGSGAVSDYSSVGFNLRSNAFAKPPATGQDAVVGDPSFAFASSWLFIPAESSVLVNAADKSSGVLYDVKWEMRDGAPDVGAYEYAGSGGSGGGDDNSPAVPTGVFVVK